MNAADEKEVTTTRQQSMMMMAGARENVEGGAGYDVPWEFVRRRRTVQIHHHQVQRANNSPTADKGENDGAGGDRSSLLATGTTDRAENGDDPQEDASSTKNANRNSSRKPPVAPKPQTCCSSNNNCDPPPAHRRPPAFNNSGRRVLSSSMESASSSTCSSSSSSGGGGPDINVVDHHHKLHSKTTAAIDTPTNTPPCGVRAQMIRKERYTTTGTAMGSVSSSSSITSPGGGHRVNRSADGVGSPSDTTASTVVVWEYRKPEEDGRPTCEYDAPWDCKQQQQQRRSYGGVGGGGDAAGSSGMMIASCHCPRVADTATTTTTANAEAVYDEPWDTPPGHHVVPASIRHSSSQGSDHHITSGRIDRLSTGIDRGKGEIRARSSLRMETTFCGKPAAFRNSTNGGSAGTGTGGNKDKDKLIQQLYTGEITKPPSTSDEKRRSCAARISPPEENGSGKRSTTKNGGVDDPSQELSAEPQPDYDTPWEFISSPKTAAVVRRLQDLQQNGQQQVEKIVLSSSPRTAAKTTTQSKSTSGSGKLCRHNLSLNFGCVSLSPSSSAKIDTMLNLNEQLWYHGNITRSEAEQRLAKAQEGSFLVRVCESSSRHQGEEYALSLKSAKGYMHMKIQQDGQRNWVLGYFSQPFESIPLMIRYYSANKLPIKGAEHMRLIRPIADQVL